MSRSRTKQEIAKCLEKLLDQQETLPTELRPYQVEALEAAIRWLNDLRGTERGYFDHATGLGKTELFAAIASACLGFRVLLVVPTKILVEQTARRVVKYTGGMLGHLSSLGLIRDEDDETCVIAVRGHDFYDIVVTTDETFKLQGEQIAKEFAPHLIVRDECHGSYSKAEQRILALFSETVVIGFTATPDYLTNIAKKNSVPVTLENGRVLYASPDRVANAHYGQCLDRRGVRWGIEEGFLAPLAWGRIDFDISLDEVGIVSGGDEGPDYNPGQLQSLLSQHWPFMVETVVQLYKRGEYDLPNRQTFAVCHSVRQAEQLAHALQEIGVAAACITGGTPDAERREILRKFKAGEMKFLSSVKVLREGWDAPNAEVCLMLDPTRSRVSYMQVLGRVLRLMPDGSFKCALVIDSYFLKSRFAPLSAPVLFGQPGEVIEDGGILIGPRSGFVPVPNVSPYQRSNIKPKVIVIPAEYETEYWADEDGTFSADGVIWATVMAGAEKLSLDQGTVTSRIDESVRTRHGRDRGGKPATFCAMPDLERVCADLLIRTQVREDGTVEITGKLYAVGYVIAQRFPHLTEDTVYQRLKKAKNLPWCNGRGRNGHDVILYVLDDALKLFEDLPAPQAKEGIEEGVEDMDEYLSELQLYKALGYKTKNNPIRPLLQSDPPKQKPGRDGAGHPAPVYSRQDAERKYASHLKRPVHKAAEDTGLIVTEGEEWGTEYTLSQVLQVSRGSITIRIAKGGVRSMSGQDTCGREQTFYSRSDVKQACADVKKRRRRSTGATQSANP